MKKILPLVVLVAFTASCSQYQYITLNSKDAKKTETYSSEFVIENDSMQITYNFIGLNAPVNIKVTNKLDKPIAIDWKRSALIVNDRAISYVLDTLRTSGHALTSTANWSRDWSTSFTSFSATTPLPLDWEMIPPKSYITRVPMGVTNAFVEDAYKASFKKVKRYANDGSQVIVKEADFTEETSPLRFRSYLTVLTEGNGSINPVVFEHSFYAANYTNTLLNPSEMSMGRAYVKKATAFGTGFAVVAGVAVIGTAAALDARNQADNNQ